MKIALILSIIIIILSLIINIIMYKKKKDIKITLLISLFTCIIALMIMYFPLSKNANLDIKLWLTLIFAKRCVTLSQDFNILSKIDLSSLVGQIYFILMNILFIITPALTAGFILSFIEKIVGYLRLRFSNNRRLYVFSEVNDKALLISKKLANKKNSTVIFTNVKEKPNTNIKSIKFSKEITNIKFNRSNYVTFYMVSDDEEKNLIQSLELIDKYKKRSRTKIYVINKNAETPVVLDSTDKGKITVEIINENERAIFNLLDDKPLFLDSIDNTISILIVGCGNVGKEFLRDAVWCSILPGYKTRILVVDKDADRIRENINVEMPDLLNNYDIAFINEDIKSNKALNEIKKRNNINYILVSMENDDKNIETSLLLRNLFLREFDREPVINLFIENEFKQEQILRLSNEKGISYNLNAFGSTSDLYDNHSIINSELEKLAIQIHLSYDPEDKKLKRYNLREYNKRSSRAIALHIKYKWYSILKDKYSDDIKENQRLFKEMYSSKVEKILVKNEHARWNAYMRSIGYVTASIDDVKNYYSKTDHYIYYLAKMHPALVDFDELDNTSKELSKITSKKINLEESDLHIIKCIKNNIEL